MKQSDWLFRLKKECTNPSKAYRISHLYRNVNYTVIMCRFKTTETTPGWHLILHFLFFLSLLVIKKTRALLKRKEGRKKEVTCMKLFTTHTYTYTGYETQPALTFFVVLEDSNWIDWTKRSVGFPSVLLGIETTWSFQHLSELC